MSRLLHCANPAPAQPHTPDDVEHAPKGASTMPQAPDGLPTRIMAEFEREQPLWAAAAQFSAATASYGNAMPEPFRRRSHRRPHVALDGLALKRAPLSAEN